MNNSLKQELLAKDRQYVWHPFTQMKDYAERDHLLIERAEGIFLYDAEGNRYFDTISSWWVNVHGHGHPRIKQAIREQMEQTDHVMFSGLTHRPGIELAEKLVQLAPRGMTKVFYSDNGSTAVEVALKMSFQYWQHRGHKQKTRFVYLENSYHGDTLGAVSVGGVELFHAAFRPLLFSAFRVPSPDPRSLPAQSQAKGGSAEADAETRVAHALEAVRRVFENCSAEIAGIIVEPLIQAAGGMIIYPADYLRGLRELCWQYDVHLIADEVAVGFGRTGAMFACGHAGITPDLMCLSKGLTAGVMPLAATLCNQNIFDAFYDNYETMKTFFHGHSFTANPLAAAVALANLRIFADERVLERVAKTADHLRLEMNRFRQFSQIADVRCLGMVGAFELYADAASKKPFDFHERVGYRAYWEGLQEGLILRPLGDTLYYWLPLCATQEQISEIVSRTVRVLEKLGIK